MLKSRISFNIFKCNYSATINAISLQYSEYGDPLKVIYQNKSNISSKLRKNEVLIKYLAAVIHPSDINTIQGIYPIKPPLPAICGNEGYAEVIDAGTSSILKEGDLVIPRDVSSGTWSSHKLCNDSDLIKLRFPLSPHVGAIFSTNPGTAFRMLKDFTGLTRGDVVIQNGGTSAVAIYVTQLAKLWGITSISIIRDRNTEKDTTEVKNVLQNEYGATFVITEQELKTKLSGIIEQTGLAKLALNCVGGKAVLPLLRGLEKSGIIVTYGGMNRLPMQVPISPLIFSDVHIRGFWISAWLENRRDSQLRQEMTDELCAAFHDGSIKPSPFDKFDFATEWKEAISKSIFTDDTPQGLSKKKILTMNAS